MTLVTLGGIAEYIFSIAGSFLDKLAGKKYKTIPENVEILLKNNLYPLNTRSNRLSCLTLFIMFHNNIVLWRCRKMYKAWKNCWMGILINILWKWTRWSNFTRARVLAWLNAHQKVIKISENCNLGNFYSI